jgi:hypothetical protein
VEKAAFRQLRRLADVIDGRGGEALRQHELLRGIEQSLFRRGRLKGKARHEYTY